MPLEPRFAATRRMCVTTGIGVAVLFPSLSTRMRMTFAPANPSQSVLVSLFLTKPNAVSVAVNGITVPASTTIPTLSNATGANALNPQTRTLYLTMRGGAASETYDLLTTQNVQLDLTLAVSIEAFFGDSLVQNIATLLGIAPSRIKIVFVHAGKRLCLLWRRSAAACLIRAQCGVGSRHCCVGVGSHGMMRMACGCEPLCLVSRLGQRPAANRGQCAARGRSRR